MDKQFAIGFELSSGHDLDLALPVNRYRRPLVDRRLADPERAAQRGLAPKVGDGFVLGHDAESMACRTPARKDGIPTLAYAFGMATQNINDRINEVVREDGRPAVEIAKAAGISKQTLNDWLKYRTKNPQNEHLLNFADELRLELRWLISGKGPKHVARDPPEVLRAADLLREMPETRRRHLVDFLESSSKAA